jgi:hypothetical protein
MQFESRSVVSVEQGNEKVSDDTRLETRRKIANSDPGIFRADVSGRHHRAGHRLDAFAYLPVHFKLTLMVTINMKMQSQQYVAECCGGTLLVGKDLIVASQCFIVPASFTVYIS